MTNRELNAIGLLGLLQEVRLFIPTTRDSCSGLEWISEIRDAASRLSRG